MRSREMRSPTEADARPWVVEPIVPERDLDGLVGLLESTFVNPWTREMLARELQQPEVSKIYVLRAESRIVAFCACWVIGDELHINNLAVAHDARRRGAAMGLLEVALQDAARLGVTRATLEVRRSNEAARRLYARLGFVVGGVRTGYYRSPVEDALILWREGLDRLGNAVDE